MKNVKVTMKTIIDRFSASPYGFVKLDVHWIIATLFVQGKISFTLNSKNVSLMDTPADEIVKYITKRDFTEKLIIEMRERASDKQIRSIDPTSCPFITFYLAPF